VDLRIFSYFSRYIDLTDGYFITQVLNAVLTGEVLETDAVDILRDYLHPDDLFAMVQKCLQVGRVNAAYDVCSKKPVRKKNVLGYFKEVYGLKVCLKSSMKHDGATGAKNVYCSTFRKAKKIGYRPRYSSLDTLKMEAGYLLNRTANPVKTGGLK
jgi:nucleoside-diphosphate-sugar epimerase